MNDEGGNRGLWLVLIVALLAMAAFVVLWYMRGGEVERLNEALRAAQAQATTTSTRLERDLSQARSETETANRRFADMEAQVRDIQRRATETSQQIEQRFRNELDVAASRIRDLTAAADTVRIDAEAQVQEAVAALREQMVQAQNRADDALAQVEALQVRAIQAEGIADSLVARTQEAEERAAALSDQLAAARSGLTEAKNMVENHPEVLALTERLAAATARVESLETDNNGLRREVEMIRDQLDAATETEAAPAATDESDEIIATLRTRIEALEAERDRLTRTLDLARQDAEAAQAAQDRSDGDAQPEGELAEARDEAATWQRRAREAETARDEALADLEQARADVARHELIAGNAQRDAALLQEKFDALQRSNEELTDAEQTLQLHLQEVLHGESQPAEPTAAPSSTLRPPAAAPVSSAPATAPAAVAPATATATATAAPADEPAMNIIINPARSVGRVIDRLADGKTYVIDKGRHQGVRPGMRFDVHRPYNSINRFTGVLQVTQPMEDISMAVQVENVPVALCPITGRAILEPGARYSPYVVSADGRPVPLIAPSSVGLDKECPEPGDSIDNPFYDPTRKMYFAIDADIADDAEARRVVEALGCVVDAEDPPTPVDYLLVRDNGAFSGDIGGPRRVTREHVANYVSVPIPVGK
ncbi:MAG: hypothetical protein LUC93_01765 [Planctomycetaceae bacterium]|nr:hypothetical protein [Planctomycetaceae bacterium]